MSAVPRWLVENGELSWLLLLVVVAVSAVSLAATLVAFSFRRSPAVRHWVLLTGLACVLATPLLVASFRVSGLATVRLPATPAEAPTALTERETSVEAVREPAPVAPALPTDAPAFDLEAPLGRDATGATPTPALVEAGASTDGPPTVATTEPVVAGGDTVGSASPRLGVLGWTLLAWALGTATLSGLLVRDLIRIYRIRSAVEPATGFDALLARVQCRLAMKRMPLIATSQRTRVPLVTGLFNPVIILPEGLEAAVTDEQLEDILAHEAAHAIRGDQLVVWLQAIARCLYWPIPTIHLLNRLLTDAREEVCDNHVLAHRDAVSYGETLLQVAQLARGAEPAPAAMGVLHWQGKLADRIAGMIDESRAKAVRPGRIAATAVLGLFLAGCLMMCGVSVVAEESEGVPTESLADTPEKPTGPTPEPSSKSGPADQGWQYTGVVEEPDGQPAAGVRLWIVARGREGTKVAAETVTNADGGFTFSGLSDNQLVNDNPGGLSLFARDGRGGFGWLDSVVRYQRESVTVRLQPTTDFRGRLLGPDGEPLVGTRLTASQLLSKPLNNLEGGARFLPLAPEVLIDSQATTDADGRFTLRGLPNTVTLITKLAVGDSQKLTIWWLLGKNVTARLQKPGAVTGRIVWPEGVEPPASGSLDSYGRASLNGSAYYDAESNPVTLSGEACFAVPYSDTRELDGDGVCQFPSVPPGNYQLSLRLNPEAPAQAGPAQPFTLASSEERVLDLATQPAVRITGRVVSVADNSPVAGATVKQWRLGEGTLNHGVETVTNANGEYTLHTAPGKLRLSVNEAPDRFVPLNASWYRSPLSETRAPTRQVDRDTEWPDLRLDPAGDLEITVTDPQGKPMAGAEVRVDSLIDYPNGWGRGQTDDRGRYVIRRVDLNDTLPVRVRTQEAISEPGLVVRPGELDGELRVELSPERGFRFRCKVVDTDNNPIAGAVVSLGTSFPYVTKWLDDESGLSLSGSAGAFKTDASGVVVTGPVWPDLGYQVSATADGYGKAESGWSSGERGETVDLPTFVLPSSQPPIDGVVVDELGQPVKGVRVYARGKAWRMAADLTDATGRFRLTDVAADVRYVFGEADGYRLGGGTHDRGAGQLTLRLRSDDAPSRAATKPVFLSLAEQHELALPTLLRGWHVIQHPRTTSRIAPLEALVRIDPGTAASLSTLAGGHFDYVVRTELAKRLIETNPQQAIQELLATPNWRGIETAISIAEQLAKSGDPADRTLAIELAEFVANLGEKQASRRLRAARLFTLLDEHARARELIESALKAIAGKTDRDSERARRQGAIALAPYNLDRARELVARTEEGYSRTRLQAQVAVAAAATDPEQAIRTLESIKGDSNGPTIRDRGRLRIALDLVPTSIERAIKLVERCEESDNRSQALGHLAVAVGKSDPQRGWRLIDQALAIHRTDDDAFRSWANYGYGGPFAALLACQAAEIGYPDTETLVWNALAACRAKVSYGSHQNRLMASINTARILALVDQQAARELLELIASQKDQIPAGRGNVSLYDRWLQAWLLVDFHRGLELLVADLAQAAERGGEDALRYGHGAVFRLLAFDPDERLPLVADSDSGLWQLSEL